MIDSTGLGAVVDECAAWLVELVVEGDGGGEAEEALQDALSEAGEGAGAVAFEGEDVLAGPEDRLDALADRREVWAFSGLVFASGSDDRGVHRTYLACELSPGVALIADQGRRALAVGARQELEGDLALIAFGRGHRESSGGPVGGEDRVQPKTPEEPAVTRAIPIVSGVAERRALDRLTASGALDRGGVDEQQIVIEARALRGEAPHQPLQRVRQPPPSLEIAGLSRDAREQVTQTFRGDRQEPPVRRYAHDRLGNAQRHDLRVCEASLGVPRLLRQEIVSRDINRNQQQVEVGVHRGPLRVGGWLLSTADFDPAAYKPSKTTDAAVESII